MAQIERRLGVGPSAIAMAIVRKQLLRGATIVMIVIYVPMVPKTPFALSLSKGGH